MSDVATSTQHSATSSVLDVFGETGELDNPRRCIAALAFHIARSRGVGTPAAFAGDPAPPESLEAALAAAEFDCTVDLLGIVWEQLLAHADRRSQGAHFTPREVADRIANLAFDRVPNAQSSRKWKIWDPSCGGGAFLLAAARWLENAGNHSRSDIVASLYASDIDPTALDVCDAALEIWCNGEGRPTVASADALLELPDDWPANFDVVIGNPPFLSQLAADTTRTSQRRELLAERFHSARGAYVDEAGLFVELAISRVLAGGVVALIVPESLLGARDSLPMRTLASEQSAFVALWLDDGQSFAAAVDVVALVLIRRPQIAADHDSAEQTAISIGLDDAEVRCVRCPPPESWAALLAFALGVPPVEIDSPDALGDVATITAGFRQHFYGIAEAVANGNVSADTPALITSGTIEPLRCLWGEQSVKFAGHKWDSPVVDYDAIVDEKVASWFRDRQVPKLLLASQTRILEAIVDVDGHLVPSVPVVSVEPHDHKQLWHLAAVLTAPAVSAWMLGVAAGTGLSHDAVRVRAATLASIPLPEGKADWDVGASCAKRAHEAVTVGDHSAYVLALEELAVAMNAAYRVDDVVSSWWWERFRFPAGFEPTPTLK